MFDSMFEVVTDSVVDCPHLELIDTHTHVYGPEFDFDREETLQRAKEAGVNMLLLPNVDTATINPMLQLHHEHPDCTRVMMGLQPEEVKENYKTILHQMEKEFQNNIYIGVGEVGLDLYWSDTYEKEQLDAFETQLQWAKQLHLPLSIHCRNAFNFMVGLLEKHQDGGLRGVMHCFTGAEKEARVYLDLGFHLGLGGVTTYKSCQVRAFLPGIPLDRIVLETDAPYLSPVPHRGQRNEPAFLADTARKLAEFYGITPGEIAEITTRNAKMLFQL